MARAEEEKIPPFDPKNPLCPGVQRTSGKVHTYIQLFNCELIDLLCLLCCMYVPPSSFPSRLLPITRALMSLRTISVPYWRQDQNLVKCPPCFFLYSNRISPKSEVDHKMPIVLTLDNSLLNLHEHAYINWHTYRYMSCNGYIFISLYETLKTG